MCKYINSGYFSSKKARLGFEKLLIRKLNIILLLGYSCNLLSNDLVDEPYIVDGRTFQVEL